MLNPLLTIHEKGGVVGWEVRQGTTQKVVMRQTRLGRILAPNGASIQPDDRLYISPEGEVCLSFANQRIFCPIAGYVGGL